MNRAEKIERHLESHAPDNMLVGPMTNDWFCMSHLSSAWYIDVDWTIHWGHLIMRDNGTRGNRAYSKLPLCYEIKEVFDELLIKKRKEKLDGKS